MPRHDQKPHPTFEAVLHQTPVTGMLDAILLGELQHDFGGGAPLRRAQRIALRMSWQLHALLGQRFEAP
jgi:hypothetical protein